MIAALCTLASASFASSWSINGFADTDAARTGIAELLASGSIPVGLDSDASGAVYVLSVGSQVIPAGFDLVEYAIDDRTPDLVETTIREGWVPFGIGRTAQTMTLLWLDMPMVVTDWRITESQVNVNARAATINRYAEEGFSLWDVSASGDTMTYLFLKFEEPAYRQVTVAPFFRSLADIADEIDDIARQGWLPNGLAVNEEFIFVVLMQ